MYRIEPFQRADLPIVAAFVCAIQEHERIATPELRPGSEIASSYTSIGAAWTARAFVKNFADGHTRARIRPAIWWRGITGGDSASDGTGTLREEGTSPTLLRTMNGNHGPISTARRVSATLGKIVRECRYGWKVSNRSTD